LMREMLGKAKRVHFIGIGGRGMSGIAEVLVNLGFDVSGSDIERSSITERLESIGAVVRYGHDEANVAGSDVVVYSSAVGPDNPEIGAAKKLGLPIIPRSQMLGELMRMRTGIAVAGAHGKTTTTSLAAVVLEEAGLDPMVVVGGKIKSISTNVRLGEGEFLVAEADESDGNFVHLSPVFALITNIDAEHLDFYGGLDQIHDAFVSFARRVPFNGAVICCSDDSQVKAILPRIDRRIIKYGFDEQADFRAIIGASSGEGTTFTLMAGKERRGELFLRLPGRHNVLNALAVCALADELGIGIDAVKRAFEGFQGVSRRFEIKGEAGGILFVDDYGHHPTEIAATIETARENYDRRIVVVFQPHRYTRTRDIHNRFGDSFGAADELFITGIYAAGEAPIQGVSADLIYQAVLRSGMRNVHYVPDREELERALLSLLTGGDLLLTLGAGDIWRFGEHLLQLMGKENAT
jgi:UDP-N-acetylmuramate--alanine ligase